MTNMSLELRKPIQRMLSYVLLILAMLMVGSCAETRMNTYRDPASIGRSPMGSIAVFAIARDLGSRQRVESIATKRLTELTGTRAVPAINLLPPTRQFSPDEATKALTDAGIDGVLFIIPADVDFQIYQPPGTEPTTGFASIYASTIYLQGYTTYPPGRRMRKPRNTYDLKLADLRAGDISWISSTITRGNAYADAATMADSLVRATIEHLLVEQLVLPPRPTK